MKMQNLVVALLLGTASLGVNAKTIERTATIIDDICTVAGDISSCGYMTMDTNGTVTQTTSDMVSVAEFVTFHPGNSASYSVDGVLERTRVRTGTNTSLVTTYDTNDTELVLRYIAPLTGLSKTTEVELDNVQAVTTADGVDLTGTIVVDGVEYDAADLPAQIEALIYELLRLFYADQM